VDPNNPGAGVPNPPNGAGVGDIAPNKEDDDGAPPKRPNPAGVEAGVEPKPPKPVDGAGVEPAVEPKILLLPEVGGVVLDDPKLNPLAGAGEGAPPNNDGPGAGVPKLPPEKGAGELML